jgi:methionyl aminopeptidase
VVEIKTPGEIDAIGAAGQVVARVLAAAQAIATPGTRLAELDEAARGVLADAGAFSPFLGYQPKSAPVPYPAAICVSVNDAAQHGIPGRRKLREGDLVSVDAGAVLDGWTADAAFSFTIGPPRPADARLIGVTEDALRAGIAAAVAGARIGDISAAIGAVGRAASYGIRTSPTTAPPGAATQWCPAWSSPSSRGSWPAAATYAASTSTAGPCAAPTAAGPRTSSIRSRSPRTARAS